MFIITPVVSSILTPKIESTGYTGFTGSTGSTGSTGYSFLFHFPNKGGVIGEPWFINQFYILVFSSF